MTVLDNIREHLENLDNRTFKIYLGVFFSILLLLSSFLVYRFYRNVSFYKNHISNLNKRRQEVKSLMERLERVTKQRTEVDALLAKDKDFKIRGYMDDLLEKLNLAQNKTREPELSTEELENGYTENKLYVYLRDLNMQKLTELLDAIEHNERIYTKEVELYKPNGTGSLNVNLIVATLEPRREEATAAAE